jgi:glycosyltransferase involved in cell wall biosynthesis
VCVWNQRDEGLFSLDGKWERWSLKRTSHFISNSHAGARFLTGKYSVDPGKVRVIKNGIDYHAPRLDRRAWRQRLEIDDSSFVACMVANLHNNKDHATLLNAWREVVMKLDRHAVLVLAGRYDGAYESLVALARELKLDRNVRFAGHITDVSGLLSAVEIGVFSSRSEGCPNGVLECMGAGLAVAGTDIEGVREIVSPNGFHLLAPPGNASELAEIILKLGSDPAMRSTVGERNRSRVREQYNAQRMCEETVACLQELL